MSEPVFMVRERHVGAAYRVSPVTQVSERGRKGPERLTIQTDGRTVFIALDGVVVVDMNRDVAAELGLALTVEADRLSTR